jgi:hypothetical protein
MTKTTTPRANKDQLPPLWGLDENEYRIQPTAREIVEGVKLRGGPLWLDDDYSMRAQLPKRNLKQLEAVLKEYRAVVFQYLLERKPKIEIAAACRCDQKPFPHLTHDPPRGDEQPPVFVNGDLKQLNQALARCQAQGENWEMDDLVRQMEDVAKARKG